VGRLEAAFWVASPWFHSASTRSRILMRSFVIVDLGCLLSVHCSDKIRPALRRTPSLQGAAAFGEPRFLE
jgi:hypothetical protein